MKEGVKKSSLKASEATRICLISFVRKLLKSIFHPQGSILLLRKKKFGACFIGLSLLVVVADLGSLHLHLLSMRLMYVLPNALHAVGSEE